MFFKYVICIVMVSVASKSVFCDDLTSQNEIMSTNYGEEQINFDNGQRNGQLDNSVYGPQPPTETWLDTARNALSGPTGQMVVTMAKEMISRSTGNSQVSIISSIWNWIRFKNRFKQINMKINLNFSLPRQSISNADFKFEFDKFTDFGAVKNVDTRCGTHWCW